MTNKVLYLIYADKRHRLISPVGPFDNEEQAKAFDTGVNHVAGNWLSLEGSAWGVESKTVTGTPEANLLAEAIRIAKFPKYQIQDEPTDPRLFARPLNPAPRKTRKGDRGVISKNIDCTSTGGPYIPQGTPVTVERVRRTGELWVDIEDFGHRHIGTEHFVLVQ